MQADLFKKYYIAIVNGILDEKCGIINAPITRKVDSIIERCIDPKGSCAITEYSVIRELNNMSLLYISLKTGKTHQIRVHMSYIGHPIVGDTLYGTPSNIINRQALHACKISLIHPITRKDMFFETVIPQDIIKIL